MIINNIKTHIFFSPKEYIPIRNDLYCECLVGEKASELVEDYRGIRSKWVVIFSNSNGLMNTNVGKNIEKKRKQDRNE